MSGRVLVDGEAAGDPLLYASNRDVAEWHRFGVRFADGGSLYLRDPRRLGAVELDPDEYAARPRRVRAHAAAARPRDRHARAARRSRRCSWTRPASPASATCSSTRCCCAPASTRPAPAGTLDDDEVAALHRAIRTTLRTLGRRGGSHTGDLPAAIAGGHCPRDGAPLLRRTVGGRTTYSCPVHQH